MSVHYCPLELPVYLDSLCFCSYLRSMLLYFYIPQILCTPWSVGQRKGHLFSQWDFPLSVENCIPCRKDMLTCEEGENKGTRLQESTLPCFIHTFWGMEDSGPCRVGCCNSQLCLLRTLAFLSCCSYRHSVVTYWCNGSPPVFLEPSVEAQGEVCTLTAYTLTFSELWTRLHLQVAVHHLKMS